MKFKTSADGPAVPGFYLLEDYQRLFEGVEAEEEEESVEISGTIPRGLHGVYFVTGPGILLQDDRTVHPFDGHGLIRRFEIEGSRGTVSFKSRFVRTPAFEREMATFKSKGGGNAGSLTAGTIPVLQRGIGTNVAILRNVLEGRLGEYLLVNRNPSNTCVTPVARNKLLSSYEGGLPFLLDADSLETLGNAQDFGALHGMHFLAHTKYDADRHVHVGLGISLGMATTLTHIELDADTLQCVYKRTHTFGPAFYVHDFAITRNAIVLLEVPLLVNFKKLFGLACNIATLMSSLLFSTPAGNTPSSTPGCKPKPCNASQGSPGPGPGPSQPLRLFVLPRRTPQEAAQHAESHAITFPSATPSTWSSQGGADENRPPGKASEHAAAHLKEARVAHLHGIGDTCGGLHHVQAYEDEDGCGITLITCLFRDKSLDLSAPFGWRADSNYFNCELHPDGQTLSRIQVNLTSNRAVGAPLLFDVGGTGRSDVGGTGRSAADHQHGGVLERVEIQCDFPSVHPNHAGARCRFAYTVTSTERGRAFPFQVLRKVDMEALTAKESDCWCAPPHCFLGEPLFVPEPEADKEDDGWVICVMYDTAHTPSSPGGGRSERRQSQRQLRVSMAILDARNLAAGPLALAHLSKPFPFGFHTSFQARPSADDADQGPSAGAGGRGQVPS